METVLNVVISIFVLIVLTWIAIFGGVGGLLSRARGGSATEGVAWGVLLGPLGWLGVIWRTRGATRARVEAVMASNEAELAGGGDPWDV